VCVTTFHLNGQQRDIHELSCLDDLDDDEQHERASTSTPEHQHFALDTPNRNRRVLLGDSRLHSPRRQR